MIVPNSEITPSEPEAGARETEGSDGRGAQALTTSPLALQICR